FQVQTEAYVPAMVEPLELFRRRLQTAPASAWVAETADGVQAYLMAYPSVLGKIAALGQDFEIANTADALYLHDLAVGSRLAGKGVAVQLVNAALATARQSGFKYSCLVSVQNTQAFWQKQGYVVYAAANPEQRQHLQTYSGPASYLYQVL
ncbi:MAG: GNAT family N-acetyltransferase, partial [Burkholderiales bacterium]|nr:GNAT family N-acetyltransferase [Burkholderiales bacterium]